MSYPISSLAVTNQFAKISNNMINGDVGMNHGEAVEKGSVEPGRRETENKKVKKRKALAPASFYPSRGHGGIKDERQIRVDSYVLEYMRR